MHTKQNMGGTNKYVQVLRCTNPDCKMDMAVCNIESIDKEAFKKFADRVLERKDEDAGDFAGVR